MSDAAAHGFQQQRDHVPRAPVYAFASFLFILLAAGAFVTWLSGRILPVEGARPGAAVRVLPREIESIDQTLFSAHLPSNGDPAAKRRALESYSWADPIHSSVAIPIDRAMTLIVEGSHVE